MEIIIVCTIIFLCFYGIFIMNKIDKFTQENNKYNKIRVLIYGDEELRMAVAEKCNSMNVQYNILDNNIDILHEKETKYDLLVTVYKDDLENLLVNKLSQKFLNITNIISACNNKENEQLYRRNKVTDVKLEVIYSNELLVIMKEKLKNA